MQTYFNFPPKKKKKVLFPEAHLINSPSGPRAAYIISSIFLIWWASNAKKIDQTCRVYCRIFKSARASDVLGRYAYLVSYITSGFVNGDICAETYAQSVCFLSAKRDNIRNEQHVISATCSRRSSCISVLISKRFHISVKLNICVFAYCCCCCCTWEFYFGDIHREREREVHHGRTTAWRHKRLKERGRKSQSSWWLVSERQRYREGVQEEEGR